MVVWQNKQKLHYIEVNLLDKRDRYLGYRFEEHDAQFYCLGFWWFHIYLCK